MKTVVAFAFMFVWPVLASDPNSARRFEFESRYEDVSLVGMKAQWNDARVKQGLRVDINIFWGTSDPLNGKTELTNVEVVGVNASSETMVFRVRKERAGTLRRAWREAIVEVSLRR